MVKLKEERLETVFGWHSRTFFCVFMCLFISLKGIFLNFGSFPSHFPVFLNPSPPPSFYCSLALSPCVCFCWSQQTCQPVSCFWRQGLVLFLLSFLSLSFFFSTLIFCCVLQMPTHMNFLSHSNTDVNKLSLNLKYVCEVRYGLLADSKMFTSLAWLPRRQVDIYIYLPISCFSASECVWGFGSCVN